MQRPPRLPIAAQPAPQKPRRVARNADGGELELDPSTVKKPPKKPARRVVREG